MPKFVHRTYECSFGDLDPADPSKIIPHRWRAFVEVGSPVPQTCPLCEADGRGTIGREATVAPPRSDAVAAPAIRGERTKAVARFEEVAFKRPHFDDGSPMLTNLKDNTREGEIAAVTTTPSDNVVHRIVQEDRQRAAAGQPASPWGWQHPSGLGGLVSNTSQADRNAALRPLGKQ